MTETKIVDPSILRKRKIWVFVVILAVLLIDQVLKFWIKTNMELGEEFKMLGLNWARIHFVENDGMAFGWKLFAGKAGKITLGVFRIGAIVFLFFVLKWLIKTAQNFGLIFCFSLIFAGAIGNILDTAFYGLIFSESTYHGSVAQFLPPEGGYNGFLMGKVVDMFYFPFFNGFWPDWVPVIGGNRFEFFAPVFNIADSAISVGVISILVFYRDIFKEDQKKKKVTVASSEEE